MDCLQEALRYHARGWSIIPMRLDKRKKPAVRWKGYQTRRATERQLRGWFGGRKQFGLGVVFGDVSGNLGSRDFDDMEAYTRWAQQHPDLAATLPTVETRRGRHVYFRTSPDDVARYRASIGKTGHGAIAYDDGELRIGTGCYSVVPPTRHPSGFVYHWQIPVSGELPIIELFESGLLKSGDATESTESADEHRDDGGHQRNTETSKPLSGFDRIDIKPPNPANPVNGSVVSAALCCSSNVSEQIDLAIADSLPQGPGLRNRQVFEFCRVLKAIPAVADADAKDLREAVRRWHERAKPFIGTKEFEETWIDFLRAWPRVKFPKGTEPMSRIFETAVAAPLPSAAEAYESPKIRVLVAVCRELQRAAGDGPFYLSARTAGRLLEVDHTTAWRWLFLLESEKILAVVTRGSRATRQANRYRYLAAL